MACMDFATPASEFECIEVHEEYAGIKFVARIAVDIDDRTFEVWIGPNEVSEALSSDVLDFLRRAAEKAWNKAFPRHYAREFCHA